MKIPVVRDIMEANERIAADNRRIFNENRVFVLNLMSSPGAGKTSLLERTIDTLNGEMRIGVIEGDIESSIDARRVSKKGVSTVQINTDGACHLDGNMIQGAFGHLDLKSLALLIVENVGNLEGDDKPLKYPVMFRESSVLLINKIDLLPYVDCDLNKIKKSSLKINPDLAIFEISCKTQEGLVKWYQWLRERVDASSRR